MTAVSVGAKIRNRSDAREMPMPGALDGVRVLDLSWGIAGPLGVLLLAEQGADVIKVEPPGGDPFRDYSGYAVWNRSRRSVTVDLKQPAGADAFRRLAADADVLVETFRPRRHRSARHRVRRAARAQPAPRVLLVPRVSRRPPARAAPRLRRAGAGEQRPAVGAAGLAAGPDLPSCTCRCRAWARCSSCPPGSSPR